MPEYLLFFYKNHYFAGASLPPNTKEVRSSDVRILAVSVIRPLRIGSINAYSAGNKLSSWLRYPARVVPVGIRASSILVVVSSRLAVKTPFSNEHLNLR